MSLLTISWNLRTTVLLLSPKERCLSQNAISGWQFKTLQRDYSLRFSSDVPALSRCLAAENISELLTPCISGRPLRSSELGLLAVPCMRERMWGGCVLTVPGTVSPLGVRSANSLLKVSLCLTLLNKNEIWSETLLILILMCQVLIVMFSSVFYFSLKGEVVCYLCFKGAIEIYLIYLLSCYAVLLNF